MLSEHIEDIRVGLRTGRFSNEAAVSQGIVLRLLGALGWPTYNTQVVAPEFALEGRRVDFALCHPGGRPRAFIEVKQVGQSEGAERQLFEYAFHRGVPMAVLTDGQEWNFFLPAETGDYGERRVYKLDLLEREVAESIGRLQRYLMYDRVCSGKAYDDARSDYQDVARSRETNAALPAAWTRLVEDEDELLVELLADRVESMCGYKPDPDAVALFLREGIGSRGPATVATAPLRALPRSGEGAIPTRPAQRTGFGFVLDGRVVECRNGREVLVECIEAFTERDGTFVARFAALPRHGRTRRYLALNRADLYPGRSDLAQEFAHQLKSGYWLGINLSRNAIQRILHMASEVAGLRFGVDFKVQLGE